MLSQAFHTPPLRADDRKRLCRRANNLRRIRPQGRSSLDLSAVGGSDASATGAFFTRALQRCGPVSLPETRGAARVL